MPGIADYDQASSEYKTALEEVELRERRLRAARVTLRSRMTALEAARQAEQAKLAELEAIRGGVYGSEPRTRRRP